MAGDSDHKDSPGISGFSRPVELELLDFLISQLDRALIAHNMIVAGHKKRVNGILKKGRELLKVSSSLRKDKVELEEKLLSQLLELQKALEEVSDLQEKMDFAQSEILSLREQIDKSCSEKPALECELRAIRSSLEGRDKHVEDLRNEVSLQSDRYDRLIHVALLEETQKLCSEVTALRSGVRVEGVGAWPRVESRSPEKPSFRHRGCHVSLGGHHLTVPRTLGVGIRELGEDGRTRIAVIGVNDGASPLLHGRLY